MQTKKVSSVPKHPYIQTIGRAARNSEGHVIMYADNMTDSMHKAITETNRRRTIQEAYNKEHGITPTTIKKAVRDLIAVSKAVAETEVRLQKDPESMTRKELTKLIAQVEKQNARRPPQTSTLNRPPNSAIK